MAVREIIPASNVLAVDIRDTLGLGSNSLMDYFRTPNLNKWSRCKPIFFKINGSFLTTESDHGKVTGFCETGAEFKHVKILDYKLPDPSRSDVQYRLHDFIGYKHKSPKIRVAGSNMSIGGGQTGDLTFQIWTCEMPINALTGGGIYGSCNALCILGEMSNGAGLEVVGYRYLSAAEMTSTTSAYYQVNVPYEAWSPPYNTTLKVNYYLAFGNGENQPGVGGVIQKPTPKYFIGNVNSDDVKAEFTITITSKPDINNPNQWRKYGYSEIESEGITLGREVLWDEFKTWTHKSDGLNITKLYISNLRGAWGPGVSLYYHDGQGWIFLRSFTRTEPFYERDILLDNVERFKITSRF